MKTSLKITAPLCTFAFLLPSCGKYDDGPGLSLRSKKSSLQKEWQLDEVEINDSGEKIDLEISRLTNDELWFEFDINNGGQTTRFDCQFEAK